MVGSLALKVADNRSGQWMAEWGCLKVGVLAPRGRRWACEPPAGPTDFPLQSPPFGYCPLLVSGALAPCSVSSRTLSVPSSAFNNEESLAFSHPLLEASVSIFFPFLDFNKQIAPASCSDMFLFEAVYHINGSVYCWEYFPCTMICNLLSQLVAHY